MNRFLLTATVLAACALPCAAQTKEVIEEVDAKLADLRIAARHADERREDVEILRRLLNKSLGLPDRAEVRAHKEPFRSTSWVPQEHSGLKFEEVGGGNAGPRPGELWLIHSHTTAAAVGPFDGVYLKGAGVVYTLRIPAGADLTFDPHTKKVGVSTTCGGCHQGIAPNTNAHFISFSHSNFRGDCITCHTLDTPAAVAKPLTDWERTRQAVRGEKAPPVEPKRADKPRRTLCDPGDLSEQLIGQLAAHAKNVRHLGEKEAITLVVTFDQLPGAKAEPAAGGPVGKPGFSPDEVQALTLGDLHLKQGKHAEAVESYLKGLIRFRESVTLSFPANVPYKDATAAIEDMTASVRGTYKSLAAAYLNLGHLEDAKQALDKATSLTVSLSTTKATDRAKPVGPAKLIVSVSKADLAGAKDATALKKAVTVERVNFPTAEGKK